MNTTVKKKGPIRTEALVPIILVLALFIFYFKYFFDSHLRLGIQFVGTKIHGAEVNVARLKTDFFAPSIVIGGIEVTDKKKPEQNIVEIGQIHLELLWDALLRGKFVIPESSILQIQTGTQRQKPGRILPPRKKKKGIVTKATETTLDQLKQKHESNLLSDAFSVAGGTHYKDQLKKLEGEWKAGKKIKALEKELEITKQDWKKRLEKLPNDSEIKQLVKKVESIKIDAKTPKSFKESIQKVDRLYKEIRTQYKNLKEAKKRWKADIAKYNSQYKELEKLIQEDIEEVLKKVNIPSLDPDEINKMLLGNLVASQMTNLMRYKDMADQYLPNKKTKKSEKWTPEKRANGVNYRFPKNKSYPRLWLQKAKIHSQAREGKSGDISGTLKNLTNSPVHLGLPTTFDLEGDFPNQEIMDLSVHINIDHTTEVKKKSGHIQVGSFPLRENSLVKSKEVELGYKKAIGKSKIEFQLQNQTLSIQSGSSFKNVDYFVKCENKNLERILREVLEKLNTFDFGVQVKGSWDSFSLSMNSNLGHRLLQAIESQVFSEIKNARENVKKQVEHLIGNQKAELKKQVTHWERQLGLSLEKRQKSLQSLETKANEKKKNILKKEKGKIEEKGKKEIKKLLDKIKF